MIVGTLYRTSTQTSTTAIQSANQINQFIRNYARNNSHVLLFDISAAMTDPMTGIVNTIYARNESGNYVHPNNAGAALMGQTLANLLLSLTAPVSPLITDNYDPYNLVTNGLFQASTPTGWGNSNGAGGTAPGTVSRVNRTDGGPGWLYQAVLNATGSDTGVINLYFSNTAVTSATHGGHIVIPRCYFETGIQGGAMDWTNIHHFRVWCLVVGASSSSFAMYQGIDLSGVSAAFFPRFGIFQGPPVTIPNSGVTRIQFYAEIATPSAAVGSGTIRIGQAEIHDLTACGY